MQHNQTHSDLEDRKYLIFSLATELYAVDLLQVKEVIKYNSVKPIPFMVNHFKGIINIRGQIVSVIDLRIKFNLLNKSAKSSQEDTGLILIIDLEDFALGTVIDDVVSIESFSTDQVDFNPTVESRIPIEFYKGVAKLKDRLVNIIDLAGSLSSDDLKIIRSTSRAA